MRDKAKELKCGKEVQKFSECCANSGFSMVFSCRAENSILKDCLSRWYADEDFKNMCKEEYLAERAEYRKTGITQKMKKVPTSF